MMKISAAVAVIESQKQVLLIRRPKKRTDPWSDHFAFPGGRQEENDADLRATVSREVREEVGIALNTTNLKSVIPTMQTHIKHLQVKPFYIKLSQKPDIIIDKKEVCYATWIDIKYLANRSLREFKALDSGRPDKYFSCIPVDDYYIWGITLTIIDRFFTKESRICK